jgi:hypothetical protein
MRTAKFFAILMAVTILLSGCDWLRKQLGMATSEDIAALKREQERAETEKRAADSLMRAREDSVSRAFQDSLALAQKSGMVDLSNTNRYHVICGSFKDYSNASGMVEKLKKSGYTPLTIDLKNGFRIVSVSSHPNLSKAYDHMYDLMDTKFNLDGDIWIYDVRQQLHIK